ncbi:MAG: caspase family protein [Acidobacteria bacterium]|nr:caspase family protein [Acidobacteriota bacterium]
MALVVTASASVALARQVALVVGNSTYAHIGRLPNPENDAVDMAAALRRIGFEVTTELDVDRGAFGRGCWRRQTGSSVRTSTSRCCGSTT